MDKFWNFKLDGAKNTAELTFYGEIADRDWDGDQITPGMLQKDLDAAKNANSLDIYINSPGGDVFAGLSIYNMLRRVGKTINVHVDGLAASAASVVAMAGDKIIMPKNSLMMIHNAWTMCTGNASEIREQAERLDRIDGQLAQIYADRTKKPLDEVKAMMAAETWMSADEAFANQFCDEIEENRTAAAVATPEILARYKNTPQSVAVVEEHKEEPEQVEEPDQDTSAEDGGEDHVDTPDGGDGQPVGDEYEIEARQRRVKIIRMRMEK